MSKGRAERPVLELAVVYRPVTELIPYKNNARKHTPRQIRQIANSVEEFGFTNPILVRGENQVVAGHGRLAAAKLLGLESVPTIALQGLSEEQMRAYILADNRLAEKAGWDNDVLAIELQHLSLTGDFDVTVTGFEVAEIDAILGLGSGDNGPAEEEAIEELRPAVTRPGDLWLLGKHRLLCGDARSGGDYDLLLEGRKAALVLTDPPYNVRIQGHAGGHGAIQHREFAMASGEMSQAEFEAFLLGVLELLSQSSEAAALQYIFMDWRHLKEVLAAGGQVYEELINLCVWAKNAAGMGSFYRSQHELVLLFRNGKGRHRNNVQLGKHGRNRSNLWSYPNVRTQSLQGEEGNLLSMHPTVKPITLVADVLFDCTRRGDIVLDAFLGSGTTLMAAERAGRHCCGLEIDPQYVDVAIRRWQRHTGEIAVLSATGQKFEEVMKTRGVIL